MRRRRWSRMKSIGLGRLYAEGRIVFYLLLAICWTFVHCEPGYLDFDNLPETNFTCAGKVIGGYYADLETSCQMFHVCTIGQQDEPMDIKFLCLNGTVFDQETRVCERVDEVDCSRSERFYYLNLELYGNTMVPIPEDDEDSHGDDDDGSYTSTSKLPATTSTTTSTTSTTTTTTTTRRPFTTPQTTTQRPALKTAVKPLPPKSNSPAAAQVQQHQQQHQQHQQHHTQHQLSTVKPVHYVTTFKTYEHDHHRGQQQQQQPHQQTHDEEEYEYEDDYAVTDGKELGSFHDPSGTGNHDGLAEQVFSPEQFIFKQNAAATNGGQSGTRTGSNQPAKPAISFQQQQFQNGGSLTVTNSHVTVTTHTAGNDHHQLHQLHPASNKPAGTKQFSSRPKQTAALVAAAAAAKLKHGGPATAEEDHELINGNVGNSGFSASTRQPDYSYGSPPLTVSGTGSGSSAGLDDVFRLPAHGFRLPSPEQAEALVAAQNKHAAELKRHQEQIDEQLKQQHDHGPQEQHLRELEQHQRRLEQLQQQELGKQLREQEHIRREQERERLEQERERAREQERPAQVQVRGGGVHHSSSSSPFEGYQRHNPQISLRLPIEHNPNQPQFLALAQADSDFPQREHKDQKRSDPNASSGSSSAASKRIDSNVDSQAVAVTPPDTYPTHANEYRESISSSSSQKSHQIVSANAVNLQPQPPATTTSKVTATSASTTSTTTTKKIQTPATVTTVQPQSSSSSSSSKASSSSAPITTTQPAAGFRQQNHPNHNHHINHNPHNPHSHHHHRVLLTPQDQYIATLPKVIITASASVSDASGKKLTYSLGNAIGPNVKIPPPSYDEYRDDDVVLDPFYLDVPKLRANGATPQRQGGGGGRRTTRSVTTQATPRAMATKSAAAAPAVASSSRVASKFSPRQQRRRPLPLATKRRRKRR